MSKSRRRLGAAHRAAIHGADASLTLMLRRGAGREAERKTAKALKLQLVAMLTGAHPMPPPFGAVCSATGPIRRSWRKVTALRNRAAACGGARSKSAFEVATVIAPERASVVLNLAEALGRECADRARALRIARGSMLELDATLS